MPEVFDREKMVVEISDMYQAGQNQIDTALASYPGLAEVWQKNRGQVVVIFLHVLNDDGKLERVQQRLTILVLEINLI